MNTLAKIMSNQLVTIEWDRSIESADRLMRKKKIRHLAVTNEAGKVYGVLSAYDVARALHPRRGSPDEGTAVCHYASSPLVGLDQNASLADAVDLMVSRKIHSVVITSGRKKDVVGIVTSTDLLKCYSEQLRSGSKGRGARFLPLLGELLHELQAAGI